MSSLLHTAVQKNLPLDQVQQLASEVRSLNDTGSPPIHYAQSSDMYNLLISMGDDPYIENKYGSSMLEMAVYLDRPIDFIEWLLNQGFPTDKITRSDGHGVISFVHNLDVYQLLRSRGAPVVEIFGLCHMVDTNVPFSLLDVAIDEYTSYTGMCVDKSVACYARTVEMYDYLASKHINISYDKVQKMFCDQLAKNNIPMAERMIRIGAQVNNKNHNPIFSVKTVEGYQLLLNNGFNHADNQHEILKTVLRRDDLLFAKCVFTHGIILVERPSYAPLNNYCKSKDMFILMIEKFKHTFIERIAVFRVNWKILEWIMEMKLPLPLNCLHITVREE